MLCVFESQAQQVFSGSFLMSVKSPSMNSDDPPMLWNIERASSGEKMAMELQDEMRKKGVSKRVVFNPGDSTWTMLMSFNNVKQGSRIHRSEMYRQLPEEKKIKTTLTKEKRKIEGYDCKRLVVESKNYKADLWFTEELKFNVCRIYKLLSHCAMMNDVFRRGDWFYSQIAKGMIVEVTSLKKSTGEYYTLNITEIKPGVIDPLLFTTKDFRISDIPEGQNCALPAEEK